jgi:hypothetical protein
MGIYTCIEFVCFFSQTNLCVTPKLIFGAGLAYKFINPKGGYGISKRTAALGNGRGPDAHRFNPIEPFFTYYGCGLYMISDILQGEKLD